MSKPPRSALSVRDMAAAVGVLVVLALVVAGLGRSCAFAPGGPQVDQDKLPTVDAPADLARYAKEVPFAVRVPAVPAGWRANSSGVDPVGGGSTARVVRVGYLTSGHRFVRLLQGDVPEEQMLRVQVGTKAVGARGPVDVGGTRWVVYGGTGDTEPIWVADTGPTRLLITGSAEEADFRALAAAALAAPVAPR
ncbi:DUF4245 domain-containing protein [Pseudonocardia sp. CA-107938]|uniref:DUF4245 domain-containing protein n=1 Tax=Pseudonocardia sp. CA-107938 TaxID=3240021 RepID=UPI003D8CEE20